MISTLTSKGQVTIPKAVRDYLGLRPGSPVEFEIDPNGRAIVHPAGGVRRHKARSRVARLRGTLKSRADTDSLMELLRNYSADVHDPGFGGAMAEPD
jgi:AbrB family looped-hinge helix DNA binding protein